MVELGRKQPDRIGVYAGATDGARAGKTAGAADAESLRCLPQPRLHENDARRALACTPAVPFSARLERTTVSDAKLQLALFARAQKQLNAVVLSLSKANALAGGVPFDFDKLSDALVAIRDQLHRDDVKGSK